MAEPMENNGEQKSGIARDPDVVWTVEPGRVILENRRTGAVRVLGYPRAAIWDLISRGRTRGQLNRALRAIASMDAAGADRLIRETEADLGEAGFLATATNRPGWVIPYVDQALSSWERLADGFRDRVKEVYFPLSGDLLPSGRPGRPAPRLEMFLRASPFPLSVLVNPVILPRPVEETAP
ncbi:MAG: hypothetical protein GY859_25860, partial [Desulfobacterales bacterium]|nr:hypothetical protein [Desulfobacterales bacterium]